MSDCDCHVEISDKSQSDVLIKLLVVNAIMFVVELVAGWYAQPTLSTPKVTPLQNSSGSRRVRAKFGSGQVVVSARFLDGFDPK